MLTVPTSANRKAFPPRPIERRVFVDFHAEPVRAALEHKPWSSAALSSCEWERIYDAPSKPDLLFERIPYLIWSDDNFESDRDNLGVCVCV